MGMGDYFSGTELWKTLLLASGYVFLIAIMFALVLRNFELIMPILFGYVIWIAIAFTLMREQKIKNLEKYGGSKILTGPLDEEEDKGEIVEFEVEKITRYYQLTKKQRQSIIELVVLEQDFINEMDKRENIMYRLNRNQSGGIGYEKVVIPVKEVEKIDVEDFDEEEFDVENDDLIEVDQKYVEDIIKTNAEEVVEYPDEDIDVNKKNKKVKKVKFNGKKIN